MGLRAKLASICLALLAVAILAISVLDIDRTLAVMVTELAGSGDRVCKEVFEQMRATLARAKGDPAAALRQDQGLRTLLESTRTFSKGVVYVRIDSPEGIVMVAPEHEQEGLAAHNASPISILERRAASSWPLSLISSLWSDHSYESQREVRIAERPFAVIRVGISTGLVAGEVHHLVAVISAVAIFAIVITSVAIGVLGNLMLRSVRAITTGVEQLTAGDVADTEVKLEIGGRDELSTLASKFNQLSRRVRSDRARWENERGHLFSLFRSITDAVLLVDADGALLFANPEAHQRLGLNPSKGNDGKPLALLLGENHPLLKMIEATLRMGTQAHDVALELPNGPSAPVRYLVSVFSLGQGREAAGALVMLRDLAPVRELESVVDYSSRLARLGGLISGVAHQLRNPLNAMTLQLELLHQDAEEGKRIESRIERIRREIKRLDETVEALLRFMRPEQLKLGRLSLNELIAEIGAQVNQPHLKIEYQLDPALPPISADGALLAEALKNLVQNAVQAMREGGTLTLGTARSSEGFVELVVADQGAGIEPENLDKIFNLYFTTKEGGTGLGLSLALRAIDLHSGSIEVESQKDLGTTFRVRLPLDNRPAHLASNASAN